MSQPDLDLPRESLPVAVEYGRPLRRWWANMIDGFVLFAVLTTLGIAAWYTLEDRITPSGFWSLLPYVIGYWLYEAGFTSSRFQGTIGKRLLGLRVTDQAGQTLSFGTASLRLIVKLLSSQLLLPYLYIFFNDRCRTLHDLAANSVVTWRR